MRRWLKNRLTGKKLCRTQIFCGMVLLFLAVGWLVHFGFTHDKAQRIEVQKQKENVRIKNIGCREETLNPLRECEDAELVKAVRDYYRTLEEKESFAEEYADFHIFTKKGQYKDTWVVFTQYRMKIKDIYTEVPGLGTLFAERKSGGYRISTDEPEEQAKEYVDWMTKHKDVQDLFEQTEEEYQIAIRSDALLREAVTDLKNASADVDS